MRIDAVIIARGGSKGIPKKNIIDFCGKPLLAWTILQAKAVSIIDEVWVSSDDNEILSIANLYGARTVLRPQNISNDTATSESAWLHCLDYIEKNEHVNVDYIIAPQVTSPLRVPDDFSEAINKIVDTSADSLLSVAEIEDHFIWEKTESGLYKSVNYDYKNRKRRQHITVRYLENGSFYIFKPYLLRENQNRLGGKIKTYIMDYYKSFQVDNIEDIKLCETIMHGYELDKI